jgi:hypothetical protein
MAVLVLHFHTVHFPNRFLIVILLKVAHDNIYAPFSISVGRWVPATTGCRKFL